MLSQFFVLSPRGDTIISKDFRGDSPQGAAEAFFRKVKFWSNDKGASGAAPPVFRVGDVTYVWVKKSGLMFACNSRFNCSPSMTLELLNRVVKGTSTENLKAFVYNEPVLVDAQKTRVPSLSAKTTPSTSVHKPIAGGKSSVMGGARSDKNEIFVDILERLTMLFSPSGAVVNSTIDGCIQMKSYLSGNPELRLALNEDLSCFLPPEGEFVVLNYRCTGDFRAPFRVLPQIEESSPFTIDVVVLVRAEIPETNYGGNVVITVPCPRTTAARAPARRRDRHGADYDAANRKLVFTVKKFQGGVEHAFRAKITLSAVCTAQARKEVGPVSLTFEIPMHNVSNLQVKYVRIAEQSKAYNPYRWVRYVTRSSSYVCRC
ncbi:hypothetical protein JL720_5802 [Aureococcus anophagefferens]|nr:hypothetical protein JL720_5802 [Aureococcus anophagefferens]